MVTTRAGGLREWALVSDHMMKGCVAIILNSLLLPIKEEDRECTGRQIISAYVMCYSKK